MSCINVVGVVDGWKHQPNLGWYQEQEPSASTEALSESQEPIAVVQKLLTEALGVKIHAQDAEAVLTRMRALPVDCLV